MKVIAAALLLASTGAHADPQLTAFAATGVMAGENSRFSHGGVGAEVGVGVGPVAAHAQVIEGSNSSLDGRGDMSQVRAGIELRACVSPRMCGLAGIDLGEQSESASGEPQSTAFAFPRIGAELRHGAFVARLLVDAELGHTLWGVDGAVTVGCRL